MRTPLRTAGVGALTAALTLGSLLGVAGPAAAASTNVDWSCDADGNRLSIGTTIGGSAPSHLLPGDQYEVVLTPAPQTIPSTAAGYSLNDLHKLTLRVPVPAGATYRGASLSGGSNLGSGTPTVSQTGGVVRMDVPGPLSGGSTIQLPAIHLQLQASAGAGSTINTVVGGSSFDDPGLSFSASIHISPGIDVNRSATCFVSPNPALTSTTVDNPQTNPFILDGPSQGSFGNRTVSVVTADDGRILYNWSDLGGGAVGWREVPGGGISDSSPSVAVTDKGNYLFVAMRDKTGMVHLNQGVPGGGWVGWRAMGVTSKYAPVLASQGNRTVATVVTNDGGVLYTWWDLGGGAQPWTAVPGGERATSSVAAALVGNGTYLFINTRNANGVVTGNQGTVGGAWVGWQSTGLGTIAAPAMSTSGNRTLLTVVRTNGTLVTDWWDLGGGGHGWTEVPGGMKTTKAAGVSLVGNGTYAFVMVRTFFSLPALNQGDPTTNSWVGWR